MAIEKALDEYLQCPHCDHQYKEGQEMGVQENTIAGWNAGATSEVECFECEQIFTTRLDEERAIVIIETVDEEW